MKMRCQKNLGEQGTHNLETNGRFGRDGVNPSSPLCHGNAPQITQYRGVDEAACPLATLAVAYLPATGALG